MAFTVLPLTIVNPASDLQVVYTAVDSVNGNMFLNDGQVELRVKNGSGSPVTVTVASVADPYGRTGDIVQAIPAGQEFAFGDLAPNLFNQRTVDVGNVHVTFSAGASISAAAVQLG